jgi:hypothetical protein
MNDLDLTIALHRDADLVGEPSPGLLEQLTERRQRQGRQRAGLLAATLGVVVIAAGIPLGGALMNSSDGGPATDPTPTVSTEAPTPSTTAPAPSATPGPSTTPAPSSTPSPATAPVLGPDGLGSLELGMSRGQAEATGLVEPFRNEPNSDQCQWRSELTDAPAGEGTVLYSDTLGVATIDAYAGVQTPEGITIGSSLAAVVSAYPGFEVSDQLARGYARVPGNSQVVYRLSFADAKVVELTLQYVQQDCYE